MALTNNYIAQRQSDAKLAARDLDQAVQTRVETILETQDSVIIKTAVLRDGTLVSNGVAFAAPNASIQGGLRYYSPGTGQPYRLEYYQAGAWIPLSDSSLIWNAGTQYAADDVAFYKPTGGWYKALEAVSGALYSPLTDSWQLLTLGTAMTYVKSAAALQRAVQTSSSIVIQGDIETEDTEALTLEPGLETLVIYSDETASIQCSLDIVPANTGTNIYWHANGTRFTVDASSISIDDGSTLWLERFTAVAQVALTGDVRWQRADGAGVSGGTNTIWTESIGVPSVPRNLATVSEFAIQTLTANAKFYVDQNPVGTYLEANTGYVLLDTITAAVAPVAIKYFRVDGQGTAAERPIATEQNPIPQGYVYNATDEGTLYIYQPDVYIETGWSPAIQIQGPRGLPGVQGDAGPANVLSVTATNTLEPGQPASVTISGVSPAQALTFNIPKGAKGDIGPANTLTVLATETTAPGVAARVEITGTAPNQNIKFWIPRGLQGVAGPNGYTAVPSISQAGVLSWAVSQLDTPPTAPESMNIKGPKGDPGDRGESMYDIWLDAGNTGTEADFIASLGIGDRFLSFTESTVAQNRTVTFDTEYPLISIMDASGNCYAVPAYAVTYSRNTDPVTVTVDLSWLYVELDLASRNARITIAPDATTTMTFTYMDRYTIGSTSYYRWGDGNDVYVYTDTDTIVTNTTRAYAWPGDANSWSGVITGYSAGHSAQGLSGTWYAAFGGGGGDASFVNAVITVTGTSYTLYPGQVAQWTLTANSTLNASVLSTGLYGTAVIYITTDSETLAAGSNISFADQITTGTNICRVTWYNGSAVLEVIDVVQQS